MSINSEDVDENDEDFRDKNNLERYWKVGKGALKIRWGTPGDFTRCRRHLIKYVGPGRAERICAQWHHEMTGIWPGHHGGDNKYGPG